MCKAHCKHETLNSDPQLQCKSAQWCTAVVLALGAGWGMGKETCVSLGLTRQAKSGSKLGERPCFKNQVESRRGRHPEGTYGLIPTATQLYEHTHVCTPTCAQLHTHTHSQ